jgi:hypothetical protein
MDIIEVRVLSGPSAEFAAPAVRISLGAPPADWPYSEADIRDLISHLATLAGITRPAVDVRFRANGEPVVTFTWTRRGTGRHSVPRWPASSPAPRLTLTSSSVLRRRSQRWNRVPARS